MLSDSIIIIITMTSPVMSMAFLSESMNTCSMILFEPSGYEKVNDRA